jgi:hypothetical protein
MSSPRLENETYEAYKERMKQEAADLDALLHGHNVNDGSFINRQMIRSIPGYDAVILAKVSELAGENIPLRALQLLYLQTPTGERKKMIDNYKKEISDYDTIKK